PASNCFQVLFNFCLKANRGDAHDYTLEFGYYNVLQHSLRGCGKKFNACSMRALGMEPKAQCKGCRRACTGYACCGNS
ncbi:MAG: hypothetical protein ACN2B6_01505, partial [Rickettsiales bacterium]